MIIDKALHLASHLTKLFLIGHFKGTCIKEGSSCGGLLCLFLEVEPCFFHNGGDRKEKICLGFLISPTNQLT